MNISCNIRKSHDIWMPDMGSIFQTLQNNALRIITFCPDFRDHVTPIYAAENILKIKDLISLTNVLLIHDYFRDKLPSTFNGYYKLEQYQDPQQIKAPRLTQVPARFPEYELTEADMQPQNHNDTYRFRNENILGQLHVPEYNYVKYGRNSLKHASILLWNNIKKQYPYTDVLSLSSGSFKNLIVKFYIDGYKSTGLE